MPEEILFESESVRSRSEIASYLRTVADQLEAGDNLTFEIGGQSVTVDPSARPTFAVKVERETSTTGGSGELSVEFELEWEEGGTEAEPTGELEIS